MKAIVVEQPGTPEVLTIKEVPRPIPQPGWVLIRVKAFGLNRSELFTRQGHSPDVKFPRILGIECVGIVEAAPDTNHHPGQVVATAMGGMGRTFDGGYAEFTCVPAHQVLPLTTTLDWATLGALPEMLQTSWGALTEGLDVQAGQVLLIRGATSSIGMTATALAKEKGLTVVGTTRNPQKVNAIVNNGADHVFVDSGQIAASIRQQFPAGVDRVLELVGATTLLDSLQATAAKGLVCMAGILGNAWAIESFEPMTAIPSTVRLTTYSGDVQNVLATPLQQFVDRVVAGEIRVNVDRVFQFDDIVAAHHYMESNLATGKVVVYVD
jgi:NADPH:quinone reductase